MGREWAARENSLRRRVGVWASVGSGGGHERMIFFSFADVFNLSQFVVYGFFISLLHLIFIHILEVDAKRL